MIGYFSGTGNSRWVAEQLAETTHDAVCDLADAVRTGGLPAAWTEAEVVGVVFPVHGWYAPRRLVRWLETVSLPVCRYRYVVCTCGDDVGKGMLRLSKHFRWDAAWSVTMPNTYIPMFQLDDDALCRRKVAEARQVIGRIAAGVRRRERVYDVHEGDAAWLKTYVVNPLFVRFCISSKGFRVEEGCTGCGRCAALCPTGNLRLVDRKPVWGNDCIHCMACIHGCPQQAIQYNKVTRKKGRYRLADYL